MVDDESLSGQRARGHQPLALDAYTAFAFTAAFSPDSGRDWFDNFFDDTTIVTQANKFG